MSTILRRVHRVGAVLLALLALVPSWYAITLPWLPGADFDVLGILFLLQNMPRLAAIGAAVALWSGALYFGARGWGFSWLD